jgi:hypothetical protein
MSGFLGLPFVPLELSHRDRLHSFLARHPQPLSGYTFATLAGWNHVYAYQWAFAEPETLLISCRVKPGAEPELLQPIGPLSVELQRRLIAEIRALGRPLRIHGVGEPFLRAYPGFAEHFEVTEQRAQANYLYRAMDLAELPGGKYSRKRNHIAQATRQYRWTTDALTPANAPECLALLDDIAREDETPATGTLCQDNEAIRFTLRHFDLLEQEGTAIRVDGRIVAFAIWEAQTPTTSVTHFERALRSYKGLYQVVNRETARAVALRGFEVINREEDLGDEGLRKAKLSYYPFDFGRFHVMTWRG